MTPDPKVKDRGCFTVGCDRRTIEGKYCPSCTLRNLNNKRVSKIKTWSVKSKNNNLQKQINKEDKANKLWKKCLILWSEIVRGNEEYSICRTCEKNIKTQDGLTGMHAGHYIDKGLHWKLSLEIENGVPQCIKCNSWDYHNPRLIESLKLKLRQAAVKLYGRDAIDRLDQEAEEFRIKVKQGIENSKPRTHDPMAVHYDRESDMEFLERKYLELKKLKYGKSKHI